SGFHHLRGSQLPGQKLAQTALSLDQRLHTDVPGAYAASSPFATRGAVAGNADTPVPDWGANYCYLRESDSLGFSPGLHLLPFPGGRLLSCHLSNTSTLHGNLLPGIGELPLSLFPSD